MDGQNDEAQVVCVELPLIRKIAIERNERREARLFGYWRGWSSS